MFTENEIIKVYKGECVVHYGKVTVFKPDGQYRELRSHCCDGYHHDGGDLVAVKFNDEVTIESQDNPRRSLSLRVEVAEIKLGVLYHLFGEVPVAKADRTTRPVASKMTAPVVSPPEKQMKTTKKKKRDKNGRDINGKKEREQ